MAGAIEDFSKGDSRREFLIRAGDEHWNPADLQAFLADLDEKNIRNLRKAQAIIVAGDDDEHQATISIMSLDIEIDLESPVPLFVSAIARLADEELQRQKPPLSWYVPNALFALVWLLFLGVIPWLAVRGVDGSIFEVFLPFILAVPVGVLGILLRLQMPWVEVRASQDGFGWNKFRGRAWRAILFLVPLILSIAFFIAENRSSNTVAGVDYKVGDEVKSLFIAAAVEHKWTDPPTLSESSVTALMGSWEELSPYEVQDFERVGSRPTDLDETWDNPNLGGERLRLRGYVTRAKTVPVKDEGKVTQLYEIGLRGESTRLECLSSFKEGHQLRKDDYVTVIAIIIARGLRRSEDDRHLTLAACPSVGRRF